MNKTGEEKLITIVGYFRFASTWIFFSVILRGMFQLKPNELTCAQV